MEHIAVPEVCGICILFVEEVPTPCTKAEVRHLEFFISDCIGEATF